MQQQMILPEGGLASFLTSNADEFDDSRLAFGRQSGINSFRDTAERMAQMGRGGDTELIHASKNELVVSPEILEQNPGLSQELGRAFDNSGVDISQYVVGAEENSVNPYTGQREFLFSLSRTVGKIKKVVKKFAPIVVPLALNLIMPGFGSMSLMAQGALSGGVTSLVQGGNFKDAMKGALMGGAVAGIAGGAKGFMAAKRGEGIQGFAQGFKASAPTVLKGGGLSYNQIQDFQPTSSATTVPAGPGVVPDASNVTTTPLTQLQIDQANPRSFTDMAFKKSPTTISDVKKTLLSGPEGAKFAEMQLLQPAQFEAAASTMAQGSAVNPGISLYKASAAGLGGAAALGAFDPIPSEPVEDPYDGPSPSEIRLAENPEKYSVGVPDVPYQRASMADIMVRPDFRISDYQKYYAPQYAAAGGEMQDFPRRTGYIGGPGTETSDSIPAMLSDGEFVMNAKAVRGAGGGSRQKGVRKMYDMMRAFEGGAVA